MPHTSPTPHIILWADDDPDDIQLMQVVLKIYSKKHHIHAVANGQKVLLCLEEAKQLNTFPCLIVLDLNMPVLSGKETLALLKQDTSISHIPVVVFTTSNNPSDRQYCDSFDTPLLTKPSTYAGLKQVIKTILTLCGIPVSRI